MIFNEVDIYTCKFFGLSKDKKIKFISGKHKGKTSADFNTIDDLHDVTSYCFWILKQKDIPMVSKFGASSILKELFAKLSEIEKKIKKKVLKEQKNLQKETEELAKTTGKKYV
jgi:hypothetical protein